MPTEIRTLSPDDASLYRELRLRALQEHPEAFATSYEEEQARSILHFAQKLTPGPDHITLGAFDEEKLVGIVTLTRPVSNPKLRHRATLAAMYVAPEARKHRLARILLNKSLSIAEEWGVSDVALAVAVGNHTARNLYASAGFVSYGIEPRCLCVDGRFYDAEWMNLRLK
jgi:GNAT superfamily N-acetyltransferase